jgi:hypothetical protein
MNKGSAQISLRMVKGCVLMALLVSPSFAFSGVLRSKPGLAVQARIDRKITGWVLAKDDNTPVPGVTVLVKNTTTGTTTDVNGKYEIDVQGDDVILVFSAVGFLSQEKLVGNQSSIEVMLASDQKTLDEVVVVGYGTQKKRDLTVRFLRSTLPN